MPSIPLLRDNIDRTCKFFAEMPKNCIKTIRYTTEWAVEFFKNLTAYPQITNAISALKQGTAIFIWPEFLTDLNTFRLRTIDWLNPNSNGPSVSATNLSVCFADALNKVCELGKWLCETHICAFGTSAMIGLSFISGLTMMYGFGNRILANLTDLETCPNDNRPLNMWKLAKNVSLFALGTLISFAAITSLLSPVAMLVCSTASLVTTYGAYIWEHPLTTEI